ncbi:MAG: hypothetical protein R3304_06995 [Longimicrobiales bacterium]|nr:hypothetical protein [Longimicrobiales bacterium]
MRTPSIDSCRSPRGIATLAAIAATALTVAGCDAPASDPLGPTPEVAATKVADGSSVPVLDFATGVPAGGTARLDRFEGGVNYRIDAEALEPGHAYTLWVVIFNDPSGCAAGTPNVTFCGGPDLVNDAAHPDMMYAGGHVVGGSGQATFAGRRDVGDRSGSANEPVGLPAYGLESPGRAEIYLIVHDHGPANAAYMPSMIQSIDGGCTDTGVPEAGVASPWNDYSGPPAGAFGVRGPNTCASARIALHVPSM